MTKKKFAFQIHARGIEDIGRRIGRALGIGEEWGMKLLPKKLCSWALPKLKGRAGFTLCSHFRVSENVEGYIVGVLLTAEQMMALPRKYVRERIMDAALFAQDRLGVERTGLGGYIPAMTNSGLALERDERIRCFITHGDALSAASSVETVKQGALNQGVDISKSTIGVVGAYGIVGRGVSLLLAELGPQKMVLTGPNIRKLEEVKREMGANYSGEIVVSTSNAAISACDAVVLATTAAGTIIAPDTLKRNCVVVDMAQPHNMSKEACRARPDVLRIDGGYMSLPNIDLGFEMGPPRGTTFACLTETIVSTMIGDKENHVGPVDISFAKYIYAKAGELGFSSAPLSNFSKPIFEGATDKQR